MAVVAQFDGVRSAVLPPGPLHLAIGMFDGVHLGHRAVIGPAVLAARNDRGTAAVLTFWPHPSALFRPEQRTRLIEDSATKARVLGTLGVQVVITEPFTPDLAAIEAEAFLPWLRAALPSLRAVYVGENFRFGHKRRGDVAVLQRAGAGLGVDVVSVPRLTVSGEVVSSTRVRALLEAGEIEAANALLGYTYFAEGTVEPGKRLGRSIGFPTLNVPWEPELRPRFGVYAVRVRSTDRVDDGLAGVANYGVRPTVEATTRPKLEVHVLGTSCPWDAGSDVTIEWRHFIRPEVKFASVEELREQIARDRAAADRFFRNVTAP